MKTKITLSVEEDVWLAFRVECVRRKMQASGMVQTLVEKQLKEWGADVAGESKRKPRK